MYLPIDGHINLAIRDTQHEMMTFKEILNKFRSESFTQKQKGTNFECLLPSWLHLDLDKFFLFNVIMARYEVTKYQKFLSVNDPNAWSREHSNPSYINDLLLSIINLSTQTVDIVNSLPKLKL